MTFDRADHFFFKAHKVNFLCMLALACAIGIDSGTSYAANRLAAAAHKQQAAVKPVVLWKMLPACGQDDWLCFLDNQQQKDYDL